MKNYQNDKLTAFAFLISIVGLLTYLYGFFPINPSVKIESLERGKKYNITNGENRYIEKLALIIIDSLRFDFVVPNKKRILLPYTTLSILSNNSCLITIKTDSPTVTLPRIKAMTSGSASNYIDVLLNFMSPHFEDDNFITKAAAEGFKIVFYGDDTWLKLFPTAFYRSEGTSSFYVRDFIEVDNNVTRHIDVEMQKNDWDIMILHYLGLDHIGHLEGPNSPLVQEKLREMDDLDFSGEVKSSTLQEEKGFRTMVIVTGDHGMKDTGGHGGVTYSEITVPLISVGKPCRILPGWPDKYTALQVDIAPTLCRLFGLPLPLKSIGKMIPHLFNWMEEDKEIINSLEKNMLQLIKLSEFSNFDYDYDSVSSIKKWFLNNRITTKTEKKFIYLKYYEYLNQLSQKLAKSSSEFKYFYISCGLFLLWCSFLMLLYQLPLQFFVPKKISQKFLILGALLHSLSFASSSYIEEEHQTWYFLWITFCILIVFESIAAGKISFLQKIKNSLSWIIVCSTHRILRKLNQTGDKWASLPDIRLFLNSVPGQPWLVALCLLALILILWLAASEHCSKKQLLLFGTTLICIFCFKLSSGIIKVKYLELYLISGEYIEIFLFWMLTILSLIQTFYYKTKIYLVWLLCGSILLRPYNIILLPLEVFISKQIYKVYSEENLLWIKVGHVWLGNLFYFYQGNGNSLANIDVTPAFAGVSAFNPIFAGVMITAHTFNSQILGFILCPKLNTVSGVLRLGPITIYCTFLMFQLNHLFIWSVFSPKLLYESSVTLLLLVLILLKHLCHK